MLMRYRVTNININFISYQKGDFNVVVPGGFNPKFPMKIFTHGFQSTVNDGYDGQTTLFVPAWMEANKNKVSVVLLDWKHLARMNQVTRNRGGVDKSNYFPWSSWTTMKELPRTALTLGRSWVAAWQH